MTKQVKYSGIWLAAGILVLAAVWMVDERIRPERAILAVLYFLAYGILGWRTYWNFLKKVVKLSFMDEDLLMIAATAGAFWVGRYREAVIAMLFFQVGRLAEEISMSRTKKSIAELIDLKPEYANLKTNNGDVAVDPQELEPGQTIVLKPGDRIPVDAVVTDGEGAVDMKALTGESRPKIVKTGDRIYSGSVNLESVLEANVLKPCHASTAARIMELVDAANEKKTESIRSAGRFNRVYTPLVILAAFLVIVVLPMLFPDAGDVWVYRGLILLVAACPCGLMVSLPLAFLGGIGAASRQGILVKESIFLEELSKVDTFVFDKTGTLTEGVFHVRKIMPCKITEEELLEKAALAESCSTHPIGISLREAWGKETDRKRVDKIREFPGYGLSAEVDGRSVLLGSRRFMEKEGISVELAKGGGTAVYAAIDGTYAGYILISDVIRSDARQLIKWLRKREYGTVILTGDNETVAELVAAELKIDNVYAELMPEDKVEHLEEFKENQTEGERIAVVGDGINDAPVLAMADVGIAMGGLGADAALEAADIILMEDEPSRIINAIRIAKGTMRAVRQNVVFAIGAKIVLIVLAVSGFINMQNAILADMGVMLINILNAFWVIKYPE